MICPKCNKYIKDDATECPYCKVKFVRKTVVNPQNPYNTNYSSSGYKSNDQGGFGWGLLGFIVSPIIALILYLCFKDDYPNRAKSIGKGAIAALIFGVVLSVLLVSCTTCALLAAA